MISTVGPRARHTRKSKPARRDGFRAHVAAEPGTGLITGCALTVAAGAGSTDADNGVKLAAADRFGDTAPDAAGLEVYGDSHYGTGQARADYAAAGHGTVIKPVPLRPAVPGGFTLDDFAISEDDATVTCPAGHTRPMSAKRYVSFGPVCAACPLRAECTTAKDGRTLDIRPHEGLLRAARAQARTPQFKKAYPTRAVIERIIAWTATSHGRRIKLRYLGTSKNNAWLHNRSASINLRTLLNAELTRQDGAVVQRGPRTWPPSGGPGHGRGRGAAAAAARAGVSSLAAGRGGRR